MSSIPPLPPAPDPTVARFLAGTASASEWDHPAHLRAFQFLLRTEPSTEAAYERMRSLMSPSVPASRTAVAPRPTRPPTHRT